MGIERFEDIEAWQLAPELTNKVYTLTKKNTFARDFGLKGQIQNAAGSSMHNIAEGFDSDLICRFPEVPIHCYPMKQELDIFLSIRIDENIMISRFELANTSK